MLLRELFRCPRIAVALSFLPLVLLGCEPFADSQVRERETVPVFEREPLLPVDIQQPERLKVMAYNLKFGGGRIDFWFDYWGDRVTMTRSEVTTNVTRLCDLIREYDPDILLAEEVDVNARRSAYYDMVQAILQGTRLNYGAYFQSWNSRYVPSEGLGRVDMGNAIFSKYPLTFAERIRLPDRGDLDSAKKAFYLHRALGRALLNIGTRSLSAYVVHTEAYDRDGTKSRQLGQIHSLLQAEPLPFVIGGDFNELPPTAIETKYFPDEHPKSIGTDFEQPPYTPGQMQPFFDHFLPAIPLAQIGTTEASQHQYFSHSTLGPDRQNAHGEFGFWNRTLDYLFLSPGEQWSPGASDVLQQPGRLGITSDPMRLSDHAPVVGTWELGF